VLAESTGHLNDLSNRSLLLRLGGLVVESGKSGGFEFRSRPHPLFRDGRLGNDDNLATVGILTSGALPGKLIPEVIRFEAVGAIEIDCHIDDTGEDWDA
jgi:hypothetical protein